MDEESFQDEPNTSNEDVSNAAIPQCHKRRKKK